MPPAAPHQHHQEPQQHMHQQHQAASSSGYPGRNQPQANGKVQYNNVPYMENIFHTNGVGGGLPSGSDEAADDPSIRWGLKGILKVIKREDPSLNMLALGEDLTTLGLNLNSPEPLHPTFASPWSSTQVAKEPEFYLPPCYYMHAPQMKSSYLQKFKSETLLYIFHNMPRDTLQSYAAAELQTRGWRYHPGVKYWMTKDSGQWEFFDTASWKRQPFVNLDFQHHGLSPNFEQEFLTDDDVRVKNQ